MERRSCRASRADADPPRSPALRSGLPLQAERSAPRRSSAPTGLDSQEMQRGRRTQLPTRNGDGIRNPRARQRALCIAATPAEPDLAELRELLRTAGVAVAGEFVQRRDQPDPDRYLGRGKLAELKRAVEEADANLVACDDELLPRQERNLEEALGVPVIDRTAIILDIFADHAHSAEGKLQVELAQLEYNLARMRGLWTHLERLGAGRMDGIGTRGPGETQIETDRRLARDRIAALRRRLDHARPPARRCATSASEPAAGGGAGRLHERRQVDAAERAHRRRRERAGRLFHTLDPTTRSFEIAGRTYLVTDTVGFIRKLPHAAGGRVLGDARGGARGRPDRARGRRLGGRGRAARDAGRGGRGAGRDGGRRAPAPARAQQGRPSLDEERRRELSFRFPQAVQISAATGEGLAGAARGDRGRFLAIAAPDGAARALRGGRQPVRAARAGRRARARGHRRGRAASARGSRWPLRLAFRALRGQRGRPS